ncbi:MAG: YciI family protein [Pirellulales bacterium]
MRCMVIVKANPNSESGKLPDPQLIAEMSRFNVEMQQAGVVKLAEGLQPSSKGARIRLAQGAEPRVIDGPFAETKELVAGFWLIEVGSLDEVIDWMKRCPLPHETEPGESCELEIRPLWELEDLGEAFSPEARANQKRQREELANRQK